MLLRAGMLKKRRGREIWEKLFGKGIHFGYMMGARSYLTFDVGEVDNMAG